MKIFKGIGLATSLTFYLHGAKLNDIDVIEKLNSEVIEDINKDVLESADLGVALFNVSPAVDIVRRSGIANDIIIRGMKKDNINVEVDGMKIYGACPNRMDPPISHIVASSIDHVNIVEGPYSVEDFGVLTSNVKVYTATPKSGFRGETDLRVGSWGYKKASINLNGGSNKVKFLLSASAEKSDQYKDGNGDDFVAQIQREIDAGKVSTLKNPQYQDKYKNLDAYTKKSIMAKLYFELSKNQELRLSYTANRSDDILYPSSKMDAIYDDSDLYNIEYIAKYLGKYSKNLKIQLYKTKVKHPMSTKYRVMGAKDYMTHTLTTDVKGAKIKNSFNINNHTITVGTDYLLRNWDGKYYKNDKPLPQKFFHSIYDIDTKDYGLFIKDKVKLNHITLNMGLRYDNSKITSKDKALKDKKFNELTGYIFANYDIDSKTKIFGGFGKSQRVPDGKELLWMSSPMKMPDGTMKAVRIGTPNLKNTKNYEVDLGIKKVFNKGDMKFKIFYSKLKDFIAYNATKKANRYENIDAKVYGFELSGSYDLTNNLYLEFGAAYQRGKKDKPLSGDIGKNMPEIPPFKYNLAINYNYNSTLKFRAEIVGSASWSNYDWENGEQKIGSFAVLNLKAIKRFTKNLELTVGVDNLFDKTYAVSNTYKDLILLPTTKNSNVMLMNEPGRNIYTTLKYRF